METNDFLAPKQENEIEALKAEISALKKELEEAKKLSSIWWKQLEEMKKKVQVFKDLIAIL